MRGVWQRLEFPPLPDRHDTALLCPLCGDLVHSYNSRILGIPTIMVLDAERAAEQHMRHHHRVRYWLWLKTGSRRMVAGLFG